MATFFFSNYTKSSVIWFIFWNQQCWLFLVFVVNMLEFSITNIFLSLCQPFFICKSYLYLITWSFLYNCVRIWPLKHDPCIALRLYLYIKFFCLLVLFKWSYGTHNKHYLCWPKLLNPAMIIFYCTLGKNCCKLVKSTRKSKWWHWSTLCKVEWLVFYWIAYMAIWLVVILPLLMAMFFSHVVIQ